MAGLPVLFTSSFHLDFGAASVLFQFSFVNTFLPLSVHCFAVLLAFSILGQGC